MCVTFNLSADPQLFEMSHISVIQRRLVASIPAPYHDGHRVSLVLFLFGLLYAASQRVRWGRPESQLAESSSRLFNQPTFD